MKTRRLSRFLVNVWSVSPRLVLSDAANVKSGGLGIRRSLWEHIDIAMRRTKADTAVRPIGEEVRASS